MRLYRILVLALTGCLLGWRLLVSASFPPSHLRPRSGYEYLYGAAAGALSIVGLGMALRHVRSSPTRSMEWMFWAGLCGVVALLWR